MFLTGSDGSPQVAGLRAGSGGGDPEGVLPQRRAELGTTGPGADHPARGPRKELCQAASGGDLQGGSLTHSLKLFRLCFCFSGLNDGLENLLSESLICRWWHASLKIFHKAPFPNGLQK